MQKPTHSAQWQTNILLAAGVMITVLVALVLAQFDNLQIRLQPTPLMLAQTTAVASTNTPLPAITMPTASLTSRPTATNSAQATTTRRPTHGLLPVVLCGEIPAGWSIYEIQPNDTLLSLAALSGAAAAEISRVNCLQNGLVVPGLRIYLPVRPPTRVACGPPVWWVQVRVQPGDTLYRLALRHGTTVYAIMQANCLNDTLLTAGRTLFLPPLPATPIPPLPTWTATATATATTTPTPTGTAVFTPTVTSTATAVITSTATPTETPTPTNTPPATETPTATPTDSETPILTPTPTATPPPPTDTATPSPTDTPAPTDTPDGG